MRRLIVTAVGGAAGALLVFGSTAASTVNAKEATNQARKTPGVSVKQIKGVGRVLVDPSGNVLYTPDQKSEALMCVGACNSFWMPLAPNVGSPAPTSRVAGLGVTRRPDGSKQVTDNGRPLYTFVEDSPGTARGQGFSDSFGGHHFTWHAVRPGESGSSASGTGSQASASTSSSNGASTRYGY